MIDLEKIQALVTQKKWKIDVNPTNLMGNKQVKLEFPNGYGLSVVLGQTTPTAWKEL